MARQGISEPKTVADLIRRHAELAPASPAILDTRGPALNYGVLNAHIRRISAQLNGLGIGRGDRVALMVSERPQAFVAYLCVMSSAVVIPLDPGLTEAELAVALRQIKARALIASTGLPVAEKAASAMGLDLLHLKPDDMAAGLFDLEGGKPGTAALPGPAQPADIAAILMSSGTTAKPKAIPLTHDIIVMRACADATHLRLTPSDVCLNFRAPHLSGPLSAGLMPSIHAGGAVLVPDRFDADDFYDALGPFKVTWYTGGPAHHEALLARAPFHVGDIASSHLRFIRSAGYNLSPLLLQKLETTFGVPCAEKYGSTESGPVACNPLPPGIRKPGTVGKPVDCEVNVIADDASPLPTGHEGEIAVRGPCVFGGYDNDPARNAAVLIDGWYRTGDLGRFDADGYLTICGRISDVINQGGRKVSPVEVEGALSLHPDVADAVCFGVPHPTLGQLVVAAVVPRQGTSLQVGPLKDHLRLGLSGYKIPAHIIACDAVPRGPSGKLLRNRAAETFGLTVTAASETPSAPDQAVDTALVRSLRAIWGDVLQVGSVGLDDNFFMMGGDSLRAVQLLVAVKAVCGTTLPQDAIFDEAGTVNGMARCIEAMRASQTVSATTRNTAWQARLAGWLRRRFPHHASPAAPPDQARPALDEAIRRLRLSANGWPGEDVGVTVPVHVLNPNGTLRPVFWCFNSATEPAAMAAAFGPDRPVFAMRSLSRVIEDKATKADLVGSLAGLYAAEIARLQPRGSFLIGGNCQSGQIAEDIAHDLIAKGRRVALLVALEYEPKRPFPGRVALFFGAVSVRHNPFLRRLTPEKEWQRKYAEVVWDVIPGKHGQYFRPPHVDPFMARLIERLAAVPD